MTDADLFAEMKAAFGDLPAAPKQVLLTMQIDPPNGPSVSFMTELIDEQGGACESPAADETFAETIPHWWCAYKLSAAPACRVCPYNIRWRRVS